MIEAMRENNIAPSDSLIADGILHRFDVPGDRAKSGNGYYVFHGIAGAYGSWKTGEKFTWSQKSTKEFTAAEKQEYKRFMAEARRQRDEEQARIHTECREACKQIWQAGQPAPNDHPYLLKKRVGAYGLKLSGDLLMVPLVDLTRTIHGIQFISADGTKKFKTGTAKQGKFHLIGKPQDNTIIICEGYATGASIHEATRHGVLVAFDAGNLKPVAEYTRGLKPDWKIIIAADNDQWTDGNPGMTRAREAAEAVNGTIVMPVFDSLDGKPTDFNDMDPDKIYGCFHLPTYEPEHDEAPPTLDPPKHHSVFDDAPFYVLGYNHGDFYYLPKGAPQIKTLKPGEHSVANLLSLAPLLWWETSFPGKQNFNQNMAMNAMFQEGNAKGVYDASKIRGRGAWEDDNRSVLHRGDKLIVDGKEHNIGGIDSKFIYEIAVSLDFHTNTHPLPSAQAVRFEELCKALTWEDPIAGTLLAGWCILAPVCGGVSWRPHIHISGSSGTGKSWIVENIIRTVVGPGALVVQGATTEAGIRQSLGNDARPVIFDEAEGEDHSAQMRMQSILELARQASSETGGSIFKGSTGGRAQAFRIRSCFCFSSIGVSASQQADVNRVTLLTLKKNTDKDYFQNTISPLWKELLTDDYCKALRTRTISLLPIIKHNARIFAAAVADIMEDKRMGDQYGALLAGTYSLYSTKQVSPADAKQYASRYNLAPHKITSEQTDERRCLSIIMEALLRYNPKDGYAEDVSISELINELDTYTIIDEAHPAQRLLKRHGIKVINGGFLIADAHAGIAKILEKSSWSKNWGKILERLPGAHKQDPANFAGITKRSTMLPIHYAKGE